MASKKLVQEVCLALTRVYALLWEKWGDTEARTL